MTRTRSIPSPIAFSFALSLFIFTGPPVARAQMMEHSGPSVPSTQLMIHGLDGKSLTVSLQDLAAMPHKSVSVFNSHTKNTERYSGVLLSDLLAKVDVPLGEKVRGKVFLTGVIAEGTDHYQVLYALAEVDPSIHGGDVMVADSMDGQTLGKDGAFKMISTEEKRPARWVRNLTAITVVEVTP